LSQLSIRYFVDYGGSKHEFYGIGGMEKGKTAKKSSSGSCE
jgi:hypothetical protein